jgi:hypothetical protein
MFLKALAQKHRGVRLISYAKACASHTAGHVLPSLFANRSVLVLMLIAVFIFLILSGFILKRSSSSNLFVPSSTQILMAVSYLYKVSPLLAGISFGLSR